MGVADDLVTWLDDRCHKVARRCRHSSVLQALGCVSDQSSAAAAASVDVQNRPSTRRPRQEQTRTSSYRGSMARTETPPLTPTAPMLQVEFVPIGDTPRARARAVETPRGSATPSPAPSPGVPPPRYSPHPWMNLNQDDTELPPSYDSVWESTTPTDRSPRGGRMIFDV